MSEALTLDEAWSEVERVLPDGWFMGTLQNQAYRGIPERWMAQAFKGPDDDADYRLFKAASGPTPVDALRNLAAALSARMEAA